MMTESVDPVIRAFEGQYRIDRRLGAGGMATVYAAWDQKHDRQVAIKVLHPVLASALGTDRFLREIRLAASFSHPGILGVIDSGSISLDGGELPFYVMPLVEGESLRERLVREPSLPISIAVDIARQIAAALSYAHARGVVHRDIKPENVLLVGDRVLVADFGIAKAVSTTATAGLTAEGSVLGTPAYMSPEQVGGEPVDARSDVFSLGAVLYEMLTGELPFTGTTAQAQITRRLHDTPTPVRTLRPSVPAGLSHSVQRALARHPADRFESAERFAEALVEPTEPSPPESRVWRLVAASVAVVGVAVALIWTLQGSQSARTSPRARSIAVLPFANVGGDPGDEFFGDGLADELAGTLAKVPGLKVAARSSAFQFKNRNVDAQEIGRRLGVANLVEGSVRRAGDQIRVTAQLVGTDEGIALWSETYDRTADQVFSVQRDIARRVSGALGLTGAGVVGPGTSNRRAYELFLQGRYFWSQRDRRGFEQAINYFRQAIEADSTYARAWAGLGDAYSLSGGFGHLAADSAFENGRAAAQRALALDSSLADAHTALGFIHTFHDFDWDSARLALERALRLDPSYGEARLFYGWYLVATNRVAEAVDSLRAAVADEPVSLILNTRLGSMLILAGQVAEAKTQLAHTLELSPTYRLPQVDLARIHVIEGNPAAAMEAADQAQELVTSYASGIRGVALVKLGRRREAVEAADRELNETGPNYSATGAVRIYAALGDFDRAFAALDRAYQNRDWALFLARSDPLLAPLKQDPRWAQFEARMRFH